MLINFDRFESYAVSKYPSARNRKFQSPNKLQVSSFGSCRLSIKFCIFAQAPWDNFPTGNLNSAPGEEIMKMFKQLNDEGTTIVQVAHAEKNAGCGKRIIHLLDGRIERKTIL